MGIRVNRMTILNCSNQRYLAFYRKLSCSKKIRVALSSLAGRSNNSYHRYTSLKSNQSFKIALRKHPTEVFFPFLLEAKRC